MCSTKCLNEVVAEVAEELPRWPRSCSGVAGILGRDQPMPELCPGTTEDGRVLLGCGRVSWFRHFIEHLACGFYFYFIFLFKSN
jgi:hypothetical protein